MISRRHTITALFAVSLAVLVGCGSNGLGMKIEFQEEAGSPTLELADATKVGALSVNAATIEGGKYANDLVAALTDREPPAGTLVFQRLAIRNRVMEYPDRASAEIDAQCTFTDPDGHATAYTITVRTHSIPLEGDKESQKRELRTQALNGMLDALLKKLD